MDFIWSTLIRTYLHKYTYPCHVLRDPHHEWVRQVGATVTPEAALFDGQQHVIYGGRIVGRYVDFGIYSFVRDET